MSPTILGEYMDTEEIKEVKMSMLKKIKKGGQERARRQQSRQWRVLGRQGERRGATTMRWDGREEGNWLWYQIGMRNPNSIRVGTNFKTLDRYSNN